MSIEPERDTSVPIVPTSCRRAYLAVLLGAMLLYGLTCAPGALWQDSGMFQYRIWQGDLRGGLGLALVKELTELMNGTVSLKSQLGKGSTFMVVFPKFTGSVQNLPMEYRPKEWLVEEAADPENKTNETQPSEITGIKLWLGKEGYISAGTVDITIRQNSPTGTELAWGSIPTDSLSDYTGCYPSCNKVQLKTISISKSLNPGTYAVVVKTMSTDLSHPIHIGYTASNCYSGGTFYLGQGVTTPSWSQNSARDVSFELVGTVQGISYSTFITYITNFLNGGSQSNFVSNANNWVTG